MEEIDCVRCKGLGWARLRSEVQIIQLGDLGHFGVGNSPTGDLLCYKYVTQNHWVDVVLWGNHDRALVDSQHAFTGFIPDYQTAHYIQQLHAEGRLMLAIEAHGFLITHAGLAAAFKQQKVDERLKTDLEAFVDWMNDEDERYLETGECDKQAWGIRDAISHRRGGASSVGGILWRDIEESLYDGFRQIFGHSADHKKHQVRYCTKGTHTRVPSKSHSYCIDVGGKPGRPSDKGYNPNSLAGIWLPSETIVRVEL